MVTVHDVADYILRQQGEMTVMKLQKLVYYSQAWSLVWDEEPLFGERIEAWANGPVVRELYAAHRTMFRVKGPWPHGDGRELNQTQQETVGAVLGFYARHSALELADLTHREDPWRMAREGMAPGERGRAEITHEAMAEYYESLQ